MLKRKKKGLHMWIIWIRRRHWTWPLITMESESDHDILYYMSKTVISNFVCVFKVALFLLLDHESKRLPWLLVTRGRLNLGSAGICPLRPQHGSRIGTN